MFSLSGAFWGAKSFLNELQNELQININQHKKRARKFIEKLLRNRAKTSPQKGAQINIKWSPGPQKPKSGTSSGALGLLGRAPGRFYHQKVSNFTVFVKKRIPRPNRLKISPLSAGKLGQKRRTSTPNSLDINPFSVRKSLKTSFATRLPQSAGNRKGGAAVTRRRRPQ